MLQNLIRFVPLGFVTRYTLLRLIEQWRSTITLVSSILLVAIIGANAQLYTTSIAQVGMAQRLEQQRPHDIHVFTRIRMVASDVDHVDELWTTHTTDLQQPARTLFDDSWKAEFITIAESLPMPIAHDGQELNGRLQVAYYENWQESLEIIEGEWPQSGGSETADLEAAIGLEAAQKLELVAGDEIVLHEQGRESSIPIKVRITAIVQNADEVADYWHATGAIRIGTTSHSPLDTNLLIHKEDLLRIVNDYIPDTGTVFGWWTLFEHTELRFDNILQATDTLREYEDIAQTMFAGDATARHETNLDQILLDYKSEVDLWNAPFGLLWLQIGALTLFFLLVTTALVRRSERREISMLQSRGALNRQIYVLRSLEAFIICTIASLIAPFVARQILVFSVPYFTNLDHLPLSLNSEVYVYSFIAALVALFILTTTLQPILNMPLIAAGGDASRNDKQVWWQRYYLDVVLFIIGIGAFWRLISTDSPIATTQTGETQADPLLLLAPALLFVALGSIMLRTFPTMTRLFASFFSERQFFSATLASWQVSREPAHYGRIAFLITLGTAIGWLAISFQSTLARSQFDQAGYAVGTDIRVEEKDLLINELRMRPESFYAELDGVMAASVGVRFFQSNMAGDRQTPVPGVIIGVDPETLPQVAFWRDDLGKLVLPPSYEDVIAPTGRVLPENTVKINFWAHIEKLESAVLPDSQFEAIPDFFEDDLYLGLRLVDDTGRVIHVWPEVIASDENWVNLEIDFQEALSNLRLNTIYWRNEFHRPVARDGKYRLALKDFISIDVDGEVVEHNWFALNDPDNHWDLLQEFDVLEDGTWQLLSDNVLEVEWIVGADLGWMGMLLNYPELPPLSAIASRGFMLSNSLSLETPFQIPEVNRTNPWFEVVDIVDFYPTAFTNIRHFVIIDYRALLYGINRHLLEVAYPNEMWVKLDDETSQETFISTLYDNTDVERYNIEEIHASDRVYSEITTDLLVVGLSGLLYMAFGMALALSVIILLVYAALTTQERQREFSVLRALGLSPATLVLSIALEQALVMISAVLLGVLLGVVVSRQILPTLAFGTSNEVLIPPFYVTVELAAVVKYGLIMFVVLLLTLAANYALVRRLSLGQSLSTGEE